MHVYSFIQLNTSKEVYMVPSNLGSRDWMKCFWGDTILWEKQNSTTSVNLSIYKYNNVTLINQLLITIDLFIGASEVSCSKCYYYEIIGYRNICLMSYGLTCCHLLSGVLLSIRTGCHYKILWGQASASLFSQHDQKRLNNNKQHETIRCRSLHLCGSQLPRCGRTVWGQYHCECSW